MQLNYFTTSLVLTSTSVQETHMQDTASHESYRPKSRAEVGLPSAY